MATRVPTIVLAHRIRVMIRSANADASTAMIHAIAHVQKLDHVRIAFVPVKFSFLTYVSPPRPYTYPRWLLTLVLFCTGTCPDICNCNCDSCHKPATGGSRPVEGAGEKRSHVVSLT